MPEPKKDDVVLSKEYHDKLVNDAKAANDLLKRLEALEAKSKGPGIETAEIRYKKAAIDMLKVEDQSKVQDSIKVEDTPATIDGHYIKDKCPYCIKNHPNKPTILDLTLAGKYQCRRCGKNWSSWAIEPEDGSDGPLPYNITLERNGGEKEAYFEWARNQELKRLQNTKA